MLINRIAKEEDDGTIKEKEVLKVDDNLEKYHTADELFEIMAKNHPHNLDVLDSKTLKSRDLVILYENMDLGTKLISNSDEVNNKAPNQYVETVIYKDDLESEDSELDEIYSNEDLHNVFTINNERIDLLCNMPSFENTLCHKFGNVHMKTSDFSNEYKNHFLFKDPYIKEQLQSFHAMTDSKQSDSAVLPTSLLDYICCKRLDDNYNFYMDNIISYVQNTIEQLKRISNGDYLTDRVKEKWRKDESLFNNKNDNDKSIALSRTYNIPLPIVGKISDLKNTWDEIIHSEMDVRCLTKLLEKKIIVEVPKILCGSFGFLGRHPKDNLTLSCKVKNLISDKVKEEQNSDVFLKLQKPETALIIHNTNSIIVLKTLSSSISKTESFENNMSALDFNEVHNKEGKVKIVELDDNENNHQNREKDTSYNNKNVIEEINQEDSSNNYDIHETKTSFTLIPSDELGYAIRNLNIQSAVLEESEVCSTKKKKSPTRVRIKSPYENKSYILDEKKRKRLLEIREKREKKKLTMNENCKITKHKYIKGAVMAQSSNSVTKLSITNKSFYNSIYGQSNNANKIFRNVIIEQKQDIIPGIDIQEYEEESKKESSIVSPGKNSLKYINRSYYLDEADTEITYLQTKPNSNQDDISEILTPSTSIMLSEASGNFTSLKNLNNSSTTDFSCTDTSSLQQNILLEDTIENTNTQNKYQITIQNPETIVPSNTPKHENSSRNEGYKKVMASVECRKSIDKIYNLMNQISVSPITLDNKVHKTGNINNSLEKTVTGLTNENIIHQASDSETSVKFRITSSNPSSFGFEKGNSLVEAPRKSVNKKTETSTAVIPKVIISSKFQSEGKNIYKTKKENKKVDSKVADNPLKAISQLLHEFDNVQKTRHKNGKDTKLLKKTDNITVESNSFKPLANKNVPRDMKNTKYNEKSNTRFFKPLSPTKALKFSQETAREVKTVHKKKLTDIIDEVKELRGEAVRGPSKRSSRIDNLAQPKKSYVQTHHEDLQNRHSKNVTPRLQKLSCLPIPEKNTRINFKNRQKGGTEIASVVTKQPCKVGPSLEKTVKFKRSANSSPVEKEKPLPTNKLLNNIEDDPESLKEKMVAVENYLNSHFGGISLTSKVGDRNQNVSRVPLIPTDIDIASMTSSPLAEESTSLGNKLHIMINSKITTNALTLTSLSKCKSDTQKDNGVESTEHLTRGDTTPSTSDHPVDIFGDKNIITAVACVSKENNNVEKEHNTNVVRHEVQEHKSCNEVLKLENALYRQMSTGTFQKRLRMKNFTLTPKQSIQHMFVLQSGDTKSLIVKSTLSQKLDFSKADEIPKLNILPAMSRNAVNFNLPLQIATVGYVFPTYPALNSCNNKKNILDSKNIDNNHHLITSKINKWDDKTVQCYKGKNEWQSLKQNTDTKGTDMFDMDTVCSKELPNVSHLTIEKQLKAPSNQKIIISEKLHDVYKTKNEITKKCENKITKSSDNISTSTSLDILVGLLNEIKKITTCQSNLIPSVNEADTIFENNELKVILNNSAVQDNSANPSVKCSVSISSLDNQAHMNSSNFSLHLQASIEDCIDKFKLTKDNKTSDKINYIQSLFSDKEINVHISPNGFVNKCTDVPSRFFPTTVNRSTNVIRSLISLVKNNSNEPYSDHINVLYSNSNSIFKNVSIIPSINKTKSCAFLKPENKKVQENVIKRYSLKNDMNTTGVKIKPLCDAILIKSISKANNFNTLQEFDPLIKMKRDILVTVYSILVFTVFAALTIPEIIFPV
ncbi:unnamed protein product [Euphydryas editha]|uniref:Uncharacterized protein n=1 Tax=Euphydryas editha TaxID=104508 RepID=A0AAU9TQ52_EUPED|nr:unnamed protein product [Euphydryas editha]